MRSIFFFLSDCGLWQGIGVIGGFCGGVCINGGLGGVGFGRGHILLAVVIVIFKSGDPVETL